MAERVDPYVEKQAAESRLQEALRLYDAPADRALNLDRAIDLLHSAADGFLRPPADPLRWAVAQYELGLTYVSRVNGERRDNLLAAVAHYERACTGFTLAEHPDSFAMVQQNLGSALADLADLDPLDPAHLERAMRAHRAAMDAHAHRGNPVDWASVANNLALACQNALHGPRAEQVEEAIDLYEAALGIFTAGADGIPTALQLHRSDNPYWSDALVHRAPFTRDSLQEGEESYTRDDFVRDRARTLTHLAIALRNRLRGDPAQNLERAIAADLEALRIFAELGEHRAEARVANNLGRSFRLRLLGPAHRNWERSIRFYRHALTIHQQGSPGFEVAQTEQNLGAVLVGRAERFSERPLRTRSAELEEAIRHLRNALRIRTRERYPYYWAMSSSMLALAHVYRIEGDREENLDAAIRLFDEVVRLEDLREQAPGKWLEARGNQGHAYVHRGQGDRRANLEKAADCYRAAAEGLQAVGMVELAVTFRPHLADALVELGRSGEALAVLEAGVAQIQAARGAAEWAQSRHRWMVHLSEFVDRLVALSWRRSAGEALEWSEFGRGRALAELQAARRSRPSGADEARWERYVSLEELRLELERRLAEDSSPEAGRSAVLQRIAELGREARSMERGFRETDPSWGPDAGRLRLPDLLEAASLCGAPILVVRVNPEGTYAWLLRPGQPLVSARFDLATRARVRRLLIGTDEDRRSSWLGSYGAFRDGEAQALERVPTGFPAVSDRGRHPRDAGGDEGVDAFATWLGAMERLLGELWTKLVADLHSFVTSALVVQPDVPGQPELIVVASQTLGLLPLHAAWREVAGEKRFWCDDVVLGYAPSVSALRLLSASRNRRAPGGLLAVANPTGDLAWAYVEAVSVANTFRAGSTVLSFPGDPAGFTLASKANVLAELGRRPRVALFSCHGTWSVNAPWLRSGFFLADCDGTPNLVLQDLGRLDLTGCELAVLSACETGMTDASDVTDEFVGLPAAFLAAGVSAVVGSLWTVSDVATALVIAKAFGGMDPDQPTRPLARLHAAQKWIRSARFPELRTAIDALGVTPSLRDHALRRFLERGERPCSHPFWWAGLTCIGHPSREAPS